MYNILERQKNFFRSGKTLDINFRIEYLKRLKQTIKDYEELIFDALYTDLGKSRTEAYMCEIGLTLDEISYMLKNIKKFAKEKIVPTPMTNFPSKSKIKLVPRGNVLIMSPWNYPFLLAMEPLVDAIASGNTVILKPSAYSPATSDIIFKIINHVFTEDYVKVVRGGKKENEALLSHKYDYIFFTGSKAVGKEVLRKSAENLTPVTLELGGKSPCIVDKTANISLTAKRIVFGKFLNCGQTCVAPDYVLCHSSIKEKLIEEIKKQITEQFGKNPLENKTYGKIINKKHFDRIKNLINEDKVVIGGKIDENSLKIEPTVMNCVTFDDAVMQEEIFGPVLPILTFNSVDDVIDIVENRQHPLALYVFSQDKKNIEKITERCRFGGGCINDVVVHLATPEMPFGGFGESGIGAYHGKFGFETFSHRRSILDKSLCLDLPMRYQPYKSIYYKLLKMFLK